MHRRALLLRALLWAAMPSAVNAAVPASPGTVRAARLHQGETALMRGDAEAAMQAFEQAGALGHDPVIELGLVRAAMQAGRYRQALGFAAHTAGEHMHDAACQAAYLWLLRLGGQDAYAQQLGSQASQLTWPDTDRRLLQSLNATWAEPWPQARGAFRQAPLRLAPYAHGQALPAGARVVATGTLVRDAQGVLRAIAPASALAGGTAQRHWVRNGRGWTVGAKVEAGAAPGLLGALRLDAAMPGALALAMRDPFPGSPAYAFAQALGPATTESPATASESNWAPAAWPLMRMGFAGPVDARLGRLLGIDFQADANPLGGPVLDSLGRLIGVSLATAGAPERLVPSSVLVQQGWASWSTTSEQSAERFSPDALYEQGLSATLQIIQESGAPSS